MRLDRWESTLRPRARLPAIAWFPSSADTLRQFQFPRLFRAELRLARDKIRARESRYPFAEIFRTKHGALPGGDNVRRKAYRHERSSGRDRVNAAPLDSRRI